MRVCVPIAACALLLAACAHRGQVERTDRVDRRMLFPEAAAVASGAAATYRMQPQERFRMPQPIDDAPPSLSGSARTALAPTTVCARAIVSEQGTVQRVDPLADRDECRAGTLPENADLMRATSERLLQWRFLPAAVCTWPASASPPQETGDCAGAEKIEPVPVSLMYAFTFEIREGRATVRGGRSAPP